MSDIEVIRNISGTSSTSSASSKTAAKANDGDVTAAQKADAADQPSSVSDELELTSALQKLEALAANLENQPVVDTNKVESIKQGLADGSYTINNEQIASKLIELESLLK